MLDLQTEKWNEKEQSGSGYYLSHLPCANHTFNLVARKDSVENVLCFKMDFSTLRNAISQTFKATGKAQDLMSNQLIFPNATWWNSQHEAVKRVVKVCNQIQLVYTKLNKAKKNSIEWWDWGTFTAETKLPNLIMNFVGIWIINSRLSEKVVL